MDELLIRAKTLYAKTARAVGEKSFEELLSKYKQAFSREDWEPFEELRAFPVFLRGERKGNRVRPEYLVDLALWEWSAFAALYSPSSEVDLLGSLKTGELSLNPTIEILRLDWDVAQWSPGTEPLEEKSMFFLFRVAGADLKVQIADWSSAAIVDVLLEQGRVSRDELIREIVQHQGTGHEKEWNEKIDELIQKGVVLSRL
jgi:hypothetical protein